MDALECPGCHASPRLNYRAPVISQYGETSTLACEFVKESMKAARVGCVGVTRAAEGAIPSVFPLI